MERYWLPHTSHLFPENWFFKSLIFTEANGYSTAALGKQENPTLRVHLFGLRSVNRPSHMRPGHKASHECFIRFGSEKVGRYTDDYLCCRNSHRQTRPVFVMWGTLTHNTLGTVLLILGMDGIHLFLIYDIQVGHKYQILPLDKGRNLIEWYSRMKGPFLYPPRLG